MFEMQRATLDAMWAHLTPGGVYVCEDVHGGHNVRRSSRSLSRAFSSASRRSRTKRSPTNEPSRCWSSRSGWGAALRAVCLRPVRRGTAWHQSHTLGVQSPRLVWSQRPRRERPLGLPNRAQRRDTAACGRGLVLAVHACHPEASNAAGAHGGAAPRHAVAAATQHVHARGRPDDGKVRLLTAESRPVCVVWRCSCGS